MSETPVYIELTATVVPLEPFRDVFIAQLGELGFDTFTDTEDGFQADTEKNGNGKDEAKHRSSQTARFFLQELAQFGPVVGKGSNFPGILQSGEIL